MLVLVPCHDDAEALRAALPAMMAALRPGKDRLTVVADRCTDDTAAVAAQAGAAVVERPSGEGAGGKGATLRFALESDADAGKPGPVAVLDADSIPSEDFCRVAETAFIGRTRAAQAEVIPVPGDSLLSRLAAYSEIVSQRLSGRWREALGWGLPLRGTGMVLDRPLLEEGLSLCATEVEDLELTLLLASHGVRIDRLHAAVRDPKPPGASGLMSQRARWLAGNLHALIARRRDVLSLLRSPEGFTLVVSLFCRPRSLFFSLRLILFLAFLIWTSGALWLAVKIVLALLIARDLVLLAGGLLVVDRPRFYLPAVLLSPAYPFLWAASAVKSVRARGKWLSARRSG
jgi:cellulose synthase/poly-beta-1,6-N-acetylglucosamine synthase-like glycosyltransferase